MFIMKRKSGHVKMIARKRPRPQPDDDSDDEHRKCLRIITFDSTIDSEIMETKSFIARLHKVSSPDGNYLVVYRVNGHFKAFNYLMEGGLSDGRTIKSLWSLLLELKDGDQVIYMLVKRMYHLSKELLQRMLDLGLKVKEESTAALQLDGMCTEFETVTHQKPHFKCSKTVFSDYGGASLDRKSTTGGCQFLGRRLISWQCKKQTTVANSTTKAEYVAAANCLQYGGLFGKYEWEYKVSSDYGLSHTQFNLLCTHYDTVAGKPVTISKASIRSDLLFDDADGIDSLNNQAIFDNIQLMGPSPFIAIPDSNPEGSGGNHGGQSSNDTSLSGNEDGLTLQSVYDFYVSLCRQVTDQTKEIELLKAQIKKLKKKAKPVITHHKAWMKSVALKTRLARKTSLKKKGVQKGYVYKQGRKSVKSLKGEPSVHKDPNFKDIDDFVDVDDTLDYVETEDDQDEGRTSSVVVEEKESIDKEVSTEALVSTVKLNEGTDKRNKGTDKQDGGTDSTKVSTDRQGEGTADQNEGKNATQTAPTTTSTPTPTIFGDDETIAEVLIT
ncbi:hypothetical protein Tco_0962579, partial [Tanacetum coccineum]